MDSVSSQKRMVVPSPWRLSALISPPWAFTMAAQTESPMPMLCLPWSAVSSAGSIPENSFFSRSLGMPQPLSVTSNTAWLPTVKTFSVSWVIPSAWSTAFSNRFASTCEISIESMGMTMKLSGSSTFTFTSG